MRHNLLDPMLENCADLSHQEISDSTPTYWYTGYYPPNGKLLKLPRTQAVEKIARKLMAELARDRRFNCEGKMYGVLLVEKQGKYYSIKAFSGLLNAEAIVTGWVPPIPGRDRVAIAEADTLADLEQMKQELIELDRTSEKLELQQLTAEFADKLERLSIEQRQRKAWRQQERVRCESTLTEPELAVAIEKLAAQSRQDGRERRHLKQQRDAILQPLQEIFNRNQAKISDLKQQRRARSRQLQEQMHDAYRLMNFLGTSSSLRELMPAGIPTGTGDCCAPKLLHYAASQGLKPIAMAEFWWGDGGRGDGEKACTERSRSGRRGDGETEDLVVERSRNHRERWEKKVQGEFYGACVERCQPLMGFMLAGLSSPSDRLDLEIIYEDEYLIAIDKPAGLLSVPGRTIDLQDSVLTRLRELNPQVTAVHRLDRDTSGILLLAWDKATYRHLSRQFHDRSTQKVYEAILGGKIKLECGTIELPLRGDPLDRPRQKVDFELGKPSLTQFQVLGQIDGYTRVEFVPVTGRTHQLRVHAADPHGLGVAILGDRLYGCQANVERLHLHARSLSFTHPHTLERIAVETQCPF